MTSCSPAGGRRIASAQLPAGTRKTVAPLAFAAMSFSGMPPIGPTVPDTSICPVPATNLPPVRSSGPIFSRMPSANISPADGPPIRSSSAIFTVNGAVLSSVTPTPSTARVAPASSVPSAVVTCVVPARPARW